jgi:hypothetical protein
VLHEREEVLVVHEQRAGEVAHVTVRGIHGAFAEREELLLAMGRCCI